MNRKARRKFASKGVIPELDRAVRAVDKIQDLSQSIQGVQETQDELKDAVKLLRAVIEDIETLNEDLRIHREVVIRLISSTSGEDLENLRHLEDTIRRNVEAETAGSKGSGGA